MQHLMIDFETMSTSAYSGAVIDMAALHFDSDKFVSGDPYTLADINRVRHWKLKVAEQVTKYGYEIEGATVTFWQQQKPEVRANLKPLPTDLSVVDFAKSFHEYLIELPKIQRWWSRGNNFDPIILSRLFASAGRSNHLEEYLKYWQVRDVRTFIDAKFDFKPPLNGFCPIRDEALWDRTFKQHDCRWDVLADVLRLQTIIRAENELEMI